MADWEFREYTRNNQEPEIHYANAAVEHLSFWYEVVKLQAERIRNSSPGAEAVSHPRLTDAIFLIVGLYRLRRACGFAVKWFTKAALDNRSVCDRAIGRYDRAFPDLKQVRHATEHFDDWLTGDGKAPPRDRPGYGYRSEFTASVGSEGIDGFTVRIDNAAVDVLAAAEAALAMAGDINAAYNAALDRKYGRGASGR